MPMFWNTSYYGNMMSGWMFVLGLVCLGLLAGAIWLLVRFARPGLTAAAPTPSPLDVARSRFAHGEIDAATFEQMRRQLEGTSTSSR